MKKNEKERTDRIGGGDRGGREDHGDRGDRGHGGEGGDGGERRSFQRKKGCRFCGDGALIADHKDRHTLSLFITERCKIVPRRLSGCCAFHQRELTKAIKRARHLAIIPYTTAQIQ